MIWLLITSALAQFETYDFETGSKWAKPTVYIIKPNQISSKEEFDREFESYAITVSSLGAEERHFPMCTINDKDRCECHVGMHDFSMRPCLAQDGRRDLQGNCHVDVDYHNCFVGSDLRTQLQDYDWKGHKVFLQHPYNYLSSNINIAGRVYKRACHATPDDDCECELRHQHFDALQCPSRTGPVPVDPALSRCHLAVKTFKDGTVSCFPIEDPRPSKADLEELKKGLPETDLVGALAMSFVNTKPDGIVMGFETRLGSITLNLAEPEPPMAYSTIEPVLIKGSEIRFNVPLSPFGKIQKHKLIFPKRLSTLASCTLDGATLHLFIHNQHKCLTMDRAKAIYAADACLVTIDMKKLKVLYQQIKESTPPLKEADVCTYIAHS